MRPIFRSLLAVLALAALLAASGEQQLPVQKVVEFIKSSVSMKIPDKQVADYLKHVRLSNKLDDRTIEELQSIGAGPKTVAVLRDLRDSSASLAPPPKVAAAPKPVPIPPPDSLEQGRIIQAVREYAMNYTKQLPNYICVQVTRRYVDMGGTGSWRNLDTVTIRLSFYDGHEDYEVKLVNNQPVNNMKMEALGGTVSQGEFASMMADIFRAESETRFDWDHWATLRGKRVMVFSFDISQANSRYHLAVPDQKLDYVPAYRGTFYVDQDTNQVLRIVMTPYDVPPSYPIQDVKTVLDYDYTKIGDQEFLLPLKSVVSSRGGRYLTKNENEFRMYRKFGTESTIKFDTPEPLPDEKTKEQPVKP